MEAIDELEPKEMGTSAEESRRAIVTNKVVPRDEYSEQKRAHEKRISAQNEKLYRAISRGYANLYLQQISPYNSFSSEYHNLIEKTVTSYLRAHVDHLLVQLRLESNANNSEHKRSSRAEYISRKIRESIWQFKSSLIHKVSRADSVPPKKTSMMTLNHNAMQRLKRNSLGAEFQSLPTNFVTFAGRSEIKPQSQKKRVPRRDDTRSRSDDEWSSGLVQAEAERYLAGVFQEHLGRLENSSRISSEFYHDMGEEYLEKMKGELGPELLHESGRVMKLNEFVNKVVGKWLELTVFSSDQLRLSTRKPSNWNEEISMISFSNQFLTPVGRQATSTRSQPGSELSNGVGKKPRTEDDQSNRQSRQSRGGSDQGRMLVERVSGRKSGSRGKCGMLDSRQGASTGQNGGSGQSVENAPANERIVEGGNMNFARGALHESKDSVEWKEATTRSMRLNRSQHEKEKIEKNFEKCQSLQIQNPKIYRVINTQKLQIMHENSKRKHEKRFESLDLGNDNSKLTIRSEPHKEPKRVAIQSPSSCSRTKRACAFDFRRAENASQRRSQEGGGAEGDVVGINSSFYFFDLGLVGPDWIEYVGGVRNGEKHGFGKWTLGNHERFEGEFRDNKAHGKGKFFAENGEVLIGVWIRNVFQKDMQHEIILPKKESVNQAHEVKQVTV